MHSQLHSLDNDMSSFFAELHDSLKYQKNISYNTYSHDTFLSLICVIYISPSFS